MRIAITGASGLIGTALASFLTAHGHRVQRLVRREARDADEIAWDPDAGAIDRDALDGVEAVVHLSGENIAAGRWSNQRKQRLVSSRVGSTQLLCRALAELRSPPRVLVSASAVGFYGDRGDEPLTESSPPGTGFLPELCVGWEGAADPARQAGIRVVHPRIGAVISSKGGALAKMLRPFRWGLGGVIGSGRQYLSWIALHDLIRLIDRTIVDQNISGAINAVAPEPVTNRQFVKTLGKVLHRPTVLPLPSFAVSLLFGEMGRTILLEGARVLPRKLQQLGFDFRYPSLQTALEAELT